MEVEASRFWAIAAKNEDERRARGGVATERPTPTRPASQKPEAIASAVADRATAIGVSIPTTAPREIHDENMMQGVADFVPD